jgi:two-component system, OmpR family, KDP operon response regulator KdpE
VSERCALLLIGWHPRGLDGALVLEQIRSWSDVPIIVLSVESNEGEKVRLLQAGADDYMVKPFGIAELIARSEAALRRYFKSPSNSSLVVVGPLSIDLVGRSVSLNENPIKLTRNNFFCWKFSRHMPASWSRTSSY